MSSKPRTMEQIRWTKILSGRDGTKNPGFAQETIDLHQITMTIQDLNQPDTLALIQSNEQNKRLKHRTLSSIKVFDYSRLREDKDRECSVLVDE